MSFDSPHLAEQFRLKALTRTGLIPRDVSFVQADLALLSRELQVPSCALTVVGKHFVHIKAAVGTDLTLVHREHSFCAHTILQNHVLVVEDASRDARFATNPYVIDGPRIRFYAGAPLRTKHGERLGAVCVLDDKPRVLPSEHQDRLFASAINIAAKLALNQGEWDLTGVGVLQLLETIRLASVSDDKVRLIALINALYDRFDEQDAAGRLATGSATPLQRC